MLFTLLTLMACEPLGPAPELGSGLDTDPEGELRVSQTTLDFGERSVIDDGPAELSFEVSNVGEGPLVVAGLNWVVGSSAFTTDAPALLELSPSNSRTVRVRFDPRTDAVEEALLFPNGEVRIDLLGTSSAPVARLLTEDEPLDAVLVGCEERTSVVLLNDGSEDLEISDISLAAPADFSLDASPPPRLSPGQQARFEVGFSPSAGGQQTATFLAWTNDPNTPQVGLPIEGLGVPGSRVTEDFSYLPEAAADLLFVVDVSPETMEEELADAQSAATSLFEHLDALNVNWQVAVVTTEGACHATVDPFLHPDLYRDYDAEQPGLSLAYALNPGEQAEPRLLELAAASVSRAGEGQCLEGLLRPDAQLHVILVTASAEGSPGSTDHYMRELEAPLSSDSDLRVSAITGTGQGCVDGGKARDAASSAGGLSLDLCDTQWSEVYARIAEESMGAGESLAELALTEAPVPETIEVSYRGRALSQWSYDHDRNVISLDGEAEGVALGEELSVTYLEALACGP